MAREIETTNLSFIDLLSCGLGGILLLLLLFASLFRSREATAQKQEQAVGGRLTSPSLKVGEEIPPPQPLEVELQWKPASRLPLELIAYPPQASKDGLIPQNLNAPNLHPMTERMPFVSIAGLGGLLTDRYGGLYARSDEGSPPRSGSIELLVPNSRSRSLDVYQSLHAGVRPEARHCDYWVFRVLYPESLDADRGRLRSELLEAFDRALKLRLHIVRLLAAGSANPDDVLDLTRSLEQTIKLGPTLDDILTGGDDPARLSGQFRHALGDGAVPPVSPDVPAVVGVSESGPYALWPKGWEATWRPIEANRRRTRELGRIWFRTVLPGLDRLRQNRPDSVKFHGALLAFAQEVANALEQANDRLRSVEGVAKLSWQDDLNAGAIGVTFRADEGAKELADLGEFLGLVMLYANEFAGTSADGANVVRVNLIVRCYPNIRRSFRPVAKNGAPAERDLKRGDEVLFVYPNRK